MTTQFRIIKKYPNRRLYDTEKGIYITLPDVKEMVINHIDVKIIDARSKKDLTQNTLLQIITEEETTKTPIFTNALLQDFIRFYHENSQNMLSSYLVQVMDSFMKQKEFFKKQWLAYENLTDQKKPIRKTAIKKQKKRTKR